MTGLQLSTWSQSRRAASIRRDRRPAESQLAKVRVANFRPCAVNDFHASDARTQTGYRAGHPLY